MCQGCSVWQQEPLPRHCVSFPGSPSTLSPRTVATEPLSLSCPPPRAPQSEMRPHSPAGGAGLLTARRAESCSGAPCGYNCFAAQVLWSSHFCAGFRRVAGSCTAVIFQATEPGFAPLVLGFMEQHSAAIIAEFALEWGLEAVLGVSCSLSSFLQSSTSLKICPFIFHEHFPLYSKVMRSKLGQPYILHFQTILLWLCDPQLIYLYVMWYEQKTLGRGENSLGWICYIFWAKHGG